jgi:hypothetical protein
VIFCRVEGGLAVEKACDDEVTQRMWDGLYSRDPVFLIKGFLIFQRLKSQKVLNLKSLFTADLIPDDVGLELPSE